MFDQRKHYITTYSALRTLCLYLCEIDGIQTKLVNNFSPNILNLQTNKFALLWGEAQKKIAYSYLKVT